MQYSIIHFASERDCSILHRLFPGETWPLTMMFCSPGDDELAAIADRQELLNEYRIASQVLGGH